MDLRGHGLSDSPTEGYTADSLAEDAIAAAEGSGLVAEAGDRVVLAGHGFGAIVAAWAAARLGARCAGLVLVDGGWEDVARTSGLEPDEFLRGLDEPPEVLRSMAAFLADRRDFDPATWDADQERAARATVIEVPSKRVVPATRPHAVAGIVGAMFDYDPSRVLPSVSAPIVALVAGQGRDDEHSLALDVAQRELAAAGRPLIRVARLGGAGHNLMRYRPRGVAAAILLLASTMPP
jgi:pimeloyl-ACP methyl ester carboxylesterase